MSKATINPIETAFKDAVTNDLIKTIVACGGTINVVTTIKPSADVEEYLEIEFPSTPHNAPHGQRINSAVSDIVSILKSHLEKGNVQTSLKLDGGKVRYSAKTTGKIEPS